MGANVGKKMYLSLLVWFLVVFIVAEGIVLALGKDFDFDMPDLIVVLGSGNKVNEPLLNDRLEAAIRAHLSFPDIPILLTGDEINKFEITAMYDYIVSKIPNANVLLDKDSLKTWDSFVFIKKNFNNAKLLVITNQFHMKRSLMFSRLLGLEAKSYYADFTFSQNIYLFIRERLSRLIAFKYLVFKG